MRVFVPYTNVQAATAAALESYVVTFVDCSVSEWAYLDYIQARWVEGQRFVNVEHDVVPWPGAIEQVWDCPHDWCWFSYPDWFGPVPPFGLVKFSSSFIEQTRDMWIERRRSLEVNGTSWWPAWHHLDTYTWAYARQGRKILAHQHHPAVGHRPL